MAHQVTFSVPDSPLGKSEIEFDVKRDGAMFGTLKVRKGSIIWRPRDFQLGYRLSWDKIASMAEKDGKREK